MPAGNTNFPGALDIHAFDNTATPVEFSEYPRLRFLSLTATVVPGDTVFQTSVTSGLPALGICVIGDETCVWIAKTSSSLLVLRGQYGSTPEGHAAGSIIGIVPTAGMYNAHSAAIAATQKKLGFKTGATGATANQIPGVNTVLGGDAAGEASWRQVTAADLVVGTSTLLKIAATTLSGNAANIDFQSIPATYKHLLVITTARGDAAAASINFNLNVNNDTGANYDRQVISVSAAVPTSAEQLAQPAMIAQQIPANTAAANKFGSCMFLLSDYAGANHKNCLNLAGRAVGTSTGELQIAINEFVWRNTAAINRLTFAASSGNLVAGTTVSIYGLPA